MWGLAIANRVPVIWLRGIRTYKNLCALRSMWWCLISPIFMAALYANGPLIADYERICLAMLNQFQNINYFVLRDKPYNPAGRAQTDQESLQIQVEMLEMLHRNNVSYREIVGGGEDINWLRDLLKNF